MFRELHVSPSTSRGSYNMYNEMIQKARSEVTPELIRTLIESMTSRVQVVITVGDEYIDYWTSNMQKQLLQLPVQHSNTYTLICDKTNIGNIQKYPPIKILQNLFCGHHSVKFTSACGITKQHQECTRSRLRVTKR